MKRRGREKQGMNSKDYGGRKEVENKKRGRKTGKMEEVVMGITVQSLMGRLITTLPCLM